MSLALQRAQASYSDLAQAVALTRLLDELTGHVRNVAAQRDTALRAVLATSEPHTQRVLAQVLGLSRQRISQLASPRRRSRSRKH